MLRLLTALALGSFLASPAGAQIPPELSGRWSGAAIYDGTVPRLFDLEIDVVAPDSLTTTLTQPYAGFDRFRFPFAYAPGRLDGELVGGLYGDEMRLLVDLRDQTLRGTVVSGGDTTATVFLQRVLDLPPLAVDIEDVTFRAGGDELGGSFVRPGTPGPHDVAVLVTGRGSAYGRGQMAYLAKILARGGLGAFVYDARGTARAGGLDTLTTGADRVADLAAALDFVSGRADVRSVGVISNSAGGWVTPLALDGRDDVAYWVSLVGPTTDLAEQQGLAVEAYVRLTAPGAPEAEVRAAGDYQRRLTRLAMDDAPWSAMAPLVAEAREAPWADAVDLPDSYFDPSLGYYRSRATYDPVGALRQLRVPTLAVFGSEDWIVPPTPHADRLRALAAEAGNDDVTVLVLDGAEHSLGRPGATVGTGAWPERYPRLWTRAPELYPTVLDWVATRVGRELGPGR